MLVLARRVDQSIVIGEEGVVLRGPIRVTVVKLMGDKVRLGVQADSGVVIDRDEIHQSKLLEASGPRAAVPPTNRGNSAAG